MTRTLHRGLLLVLLILLPLPLLAQDLPRMLPADVLGYAKIDQPYKLVTDMITRGIGTAKAAGAEIDDPDEAISEGLGEMDDSFGLEAGTLMTWMQSVSSIEMAMFEFELTGFVPEVEFALLLRTPQAKTIYESTTKLLERQQLGERNQDGTMEVDAMGFWQGILGYRDDRLVLASDSDRLAQTMEDLSEVKAGSLAQSPHFKAMFGGQKKSDTMLYANLGRVLAMVRDEMPRADLRDFDVIAAPLGLWDLEAFGYRQVGDQSWTQVRSQKTIPAFSFLAGPKGTARIPSRLPANTVFSATWPGELMPVWRKASGYFLDSSRFPGAARLTERLAGVQRFVGVEIPDLVAAASGGITFGIMPMSGHREEEFMYGVIGLSEEQQGDELVARVMENMARRRKATVRIDQAGTSTWFRMTRDGKDHPLAVVLVDDLAVIGSEKTIGTVVASLEGKGKTVAQTNALESLGQKASMYMTSNIAAAWTGFARELGEEKLEELSDHIPCFGATMDITPKSLMVHSNRTIWTLMTTLSMGFMAVATDVAMDEAEAVSAEAKAPAKATDERPASRPRKATDKPAPKPTGGDGGR